FLLVARGARLQLLRMALQHHDHVIHGLGDSAREISGTERRHHVVLDDELGMQIRQRAFQPVARSEEQRLNSSHVKISYAVFCLILLPPPSSPFPYTTLFRSFPAGCARRAPPTPPDGPPAP